MIIVLSLFFLGAGLALIVNTLMLPAPSNFRYGTRGRWYSGVVPVAVGAAVMLSGLALLFSGNDSSPGSSP